MKIIRPTLWTFALAFVLVAAAPQALAACGGPDLGEGVLADVGLGSTSVEWRIFAEHAGATLTVSTPCGIIQRTYGEGETPFFDLKELAPDNPDGAYSWQIRIQPQVSSQVQEALRESRLTGDEEIVKQLCRKGMLPAGPFIQTGEFSVLEGLIIDPQSGEERAKVKTLPQDDAALSLGVASEDNLNRVTAKTVISGDLTVYNSLCVGFDCLTSETYGADTIRLKENNLRIHADDTSTAASFPRTDWRLEFNSQANGGGSYFRVVDASASRNVMTLEANAPSHSLYVDDGGRVGFGTSTPSVELHAVDGDTPTLRLAQDGSSGFAPQTWDVAGNETSFFIRDATNGSTLPLRIRPGASSNALVIDTDSEIGIGTLTADANLNVVQTNTTSGFHLERAGNPVTMLFEDTTAGQKWEFKINSAGGFAVNDPGSPNGELTLNADGDLTIEGEITTSGSCSIGCDRVFLEDYPLESIEDHADYMWENRHLPGVGPTTEGAKINLSQKTTGILNELEKAHIYIEQLHARVEALESRQAAEPADDAVSEH